MKGKMRKIRDLNYQNDKQLSANRNVYQSPRMLAFMGLLLYIFCSLERKNDRDEAKRNRGTSCVCFFVRTVVE